MVVITQRSGAGQRRRPRVPGSRQAASVRVQARKPGRELFAALAGLIAAIGIVAGCGTATAPHSGTKSVPQSAKVVLNVNLINWTGSGPRNWTLHCEPPGGTAPDPAAACKTLLALKQPFEPVRKPVMCPMIMFSSRQIEVSGTWFGQKVHRVIIDGSCDVGVFNSLHKTFY
jgi:hypothetical protein